MDAVEFFKSMKRMCYSGEMCEKCPLYNNFSEIGSVCDVLLHIKDEKASRVKSIVEQWAKEHPVKPIKTRQSEFLKIFPETAVRNGVIFLCPKLTCQTLAGTDSISRCERNDCAKCRREYWLAEVTDND